jgi:hypothetical protein
MDDDHAILVIAMSHSMVSTPKSSAFWNAGKRVFRSEPTRAAMACRSNAWAGRARMCENEEKKRR